MDKAAASEIYLPAAVEALEAFPVEPARIDFVSVSENVTFRVTDGGGGVYVLRLHRPWYHDFASLASERIWTRALAGAGIAVPPPVPSRDGSDYVRVAIDGTGEQRYAGLARWIDGDLLSDVMEREHDPALAEAHFRRLGGLLGALHNQASAWTPPPPFKRHRLDADGLMGEAPFWGPFWDHPVLTPTDRTLLIGVRDQIHAALLRLGQDPAAYSVIHADLHPGNVLIGGGRLAVIDFDDAAFGWHMYDLAVALVFYEGHAGFAGFRDSLVEGYRGVRPLSDQALGLLPMFLLVRRMVQLGWLHQRPEIAPPPDLAARKDDICAQAAAFEPPC